MNTKVSIIMPVYNEEKYIDDCLKSLIGQSYNIENIELLIIDGKSSDETLSIVSNYLNVLPIKVLVNEKRIVTYALNIGIEAAKGDYIIRLDAHSIYSKNYIEKCVFYLSTIECDNVGGIAITKGKGFWGHVNADILSSRFGVGGSKFRIGSKSGYVDTVPFGAFKKEIFKKIGLFNVNLPRSEDNDINSRIREAGGKVYLASDIQFTYLCRDSFIGIMSQAVKNGNCLFFTLRQNRKAMSLRHFIPFLFCLSFFFLIPLSIFFVIFRYILFGEIGLYLILDLIFSITEGNKKYAFIKFLIYPIFHFIYGFGSVLSLLNIKLY